MFSRPPNHHSPSFASEQAQQVSSNITNKLLGTLSDPTNPITHSNLADRTDHYVAFATGHQVAQERINQGAYMSYREDKLQIQREADNSIGNDNNVLLKGVKVYINGYLEGTTDIEIKKIVVQCGGQIVSVASKSTHIITSRGLSGSKTHKILMSKSSKVHVVKPEWVFDSVAYGKRRPERPYAILHTQVQAQETKFAFTTGLLMVDTSFGNRQGGKILMNEPQTSYTGLDM